MIKVSSRVTGPKKKDSCYYFISKTAFSQFILENRSANIFLSDTFYERKPSSSNNCTLHKPWNIKWYHWTTFDKAPRNSSLASAGGSVKNQHRHRPGNIEKQWNTSSTLQWGNPMAPSPKRNQLLCLDSHIKDSQRKYMYIHKIHVKRQENHFHLILSSTYMCHLHPMPLVKKTLKPFGLPPKNHKILWKQYMHALGTMLKHKYTNRWEQLC